jgi:Arc/MetJ-type ribon-helix-helix transcriptional regulator
MPRLTITISEDQSELLEELSGEAGEYDSKSEAVREFIQAGERQVELQAQVDELRERV